MVRDVVNHRAVRSGGVLGGTHDEMVRNILPSQSDHVSQYKHFLDLYLRGKIALKVMIIVIVDIFQVFKTQRLQAIHSLNAYKEKYEDSNHVLFNRKKELTPKLLISNYH